MIGKIQAMDVPVENIDKHFSALGRIGNLGPKSEDGYLRASWSDEESAAMEYIRFAGASQGLTAEYDGVGNLYLTTPGRSNKIIQVGSHLDTVPKGGQYDGGAGIVAGLEAILALKNLWSDMGCSLQLVVWRGEESATYAAVCKGSRAAFGLNDPSILKNKYRGKTLEEAIVGQGFDSTCIRQRKPTLSQDQIDSIDAHFELHIEQANRLQSGQNQVGLVTSIRGAVRFRIILEGEAAHSGATPMGVSFRRDANLAMAYMQVELDRLVIDRIGQGEDLVQTVGVVNTDQDFNNAELKIFENAYTKISPFGYFTLDVRSSKAATLTAYTLEARQLIENLARRFRVDAQVVEINAQPPIEALDDGLLDLLAESCVELGISYAKIPSGALHDAAVVASQQRSDGSPIPVGLVFIPCRDGVSHNPREFASHVDMGMGSQVLTRTMWKMAGG